MKSGAVLSLEHYIACVYERLTFQTEGELQRQTFYVQRFLIKLRIIVEQTNLK